LLRGKRAEKKKQAKEMIDSEEKAVEASVRKILAQSTPWCVVAFPPLRNDPSGRVHWLKYLDQRVSSTLAFFAAKRHIVIWRYTRNFPPDREPGA
jgi:hypothetical protein